MSSSHVPPQEEAVSGAFRFASFASPAAHHTGKRRLTTLRGKTLVIVVMTCMSLLIILYAALRVFLLGSFVTLEEQALRTDVTRATSTLTDTLQGVATLNESYAIWDDTYAFVDDRNQTYIDKNWYDSYFKEARFNLVVIADPAGHVVFSKAFDFNAEQAIPVPQRFQHLAPTDPLLNAPTLTTTIKGVVLLSDMPMLITAHPIITSKAAGPARGTLLIGRYLDAQEMARLADVTHLSLDTLWGAEAAAPTLQHLVSSVPRDGQPLIQPINSDVIAGYTRIADVDGGEGLVLRVQAPRTIYRQGELGIWYFLVSLLVAGIVFGSVILVLLERVILSRLTRLTTSVQDVGFQSDLSVRVSVPGTDELAVLGHTVNGMLAALEHAQREREHTAAARKQLQLQEENMRAKRAFVAVISHELRTPLTPIRGFVDLLLQDTDQLNEDQTFALNIIKSNTMRMNGLIEDLLDLGQLEAHRVTLTLAPVSLDDVIAETIQLLQSELARKQLVVTQRIPPDLPVIEADRKRVEQIVTNLLSNAIKYSYPHSSICVTARLTANNEVETQVQDTGVGLTTYQQQQLFTPFYRADHALRDLEIGTGLGLSIVNAFVELHHGRIWVESEPGVGSSFTFTLPLRHLP